MDFDPKKTCDLDSKLDPLSWEGINELLYLPFLVNLVNLRTRRSQGNLAIWSWSWLQWHSNQSFLSLDLNDSSIFVSNGQISGELGCSRHIWGIVLLCWRTNVRAIDHHGRPKIAFCRRGFFIRGGCWRFGNAVNSLQGHIGPPCPR